MSSSQLDLGEYGVSAQSTTASEPTNTTDAETSPDIPLLGFESTPDAATVTDEIAEARKADWVVYTGRYPHIFDAVRLGFGIGHREDSSYQWTPDEVDLPTHFLDNDYRDADLDRFIQRVFEYEPEIAVLGDIYNADDLDDHLLAAAEIWDSYPEMELILVPKTEDVLQEIPSDFILGFPNGTSDIQALDIATHKEWRSLPHRLHILGGTPLSAYEHIVELTRNHITDTPVADIAGVDWNGYQRYAENHGDYAAADGGWHRNLREQYIPKRDLIRYSLLNAKHYWVSMGVWPGMSPKDLPTRTELLTANQGGPVDIRLSTDQRELVLSPPPSTERHSQPIYRTDDTQTEIIEPLSPLASVFSDLSWEPDGALSNEAAYSTPNAHYTEPTCFGCGAHILAEPERCSGAKHNGRNTATLQLVSYEHQRRDTTNDYESVANNGPSTLDSDTPFPAIHCFCSDACRERAEYQSPHLLLRVDHNTDAKWPNGTVITELTVANRV
jgi:hypothetical protein